jgi:putative ABC transport system permease protein
VTGQHKSDIKKSDIRNQKFMFNNYFKIMVRNLLKRKIFTLINLLGLAIGMAVCLLLVLFIKNEFGYDDFHERGDQVYRVAIERKYPGRSAYLGEIPQSVGQAIKHEFPEVLESVRMLSFGGNASIINVGDKVFEEKKIMAVDSNFFQVFTGSFLQGDGNTALQKPGTAIVNESTAKKYFGSVDNAMGKPITLNEFQHYEISGVCRDWPEKSHFQFNLLISTTGLQGLNSPNYYDLTTYTYLLLNKNVSSKSLEAKFPLIIEKYVAGTIEKGFGETYEQFRKEGNGYRYFLQPIKKIHLYSNLEDELRPNSSIGTIYLFGAIAIFILFLACVNFINLSTALSVERAREVGIRKTFGSNKNALIRQFLSESVLFSLISMLVALLLVFLFVPLLNNISGNELTFVYFLNPFRLLPVFGFAILVGIVAGLYPALVLSSFEPLAILKSRFKSTRYGIALRNGLVIFQFTISVILIICTIVVNNQMQYALGDKLGFKKDHIISVEGLYHLQNQKSSFINELSKIAGVQDISKCSGMPDGKYLSSCAMQVVDTKLSRTQKTMYVDEEYLKLLDLQLEEGRFFAKDLANDSLGLILNEKAVEDFGLKNPIGSRITSTEVFLNPGDGKSQNVFTVIGVVKNFHFQSLHQKIAPLVLVNSNKFGWGMAAIRIKGEHFKTSVAEIEKIWNRFDPKHTLQYNFLDQSLATQYKAEQTAQRIFTIFSLLAISIACIGLFGLATYSTLQRAKEISIRKVLGATTGNIIFILSKDFLRLVIVSMLIAFPAAWWAMYKWLLDFAYRINITWWIFLLAGTIAVIIAFVTISFQATKAAIANPVKSLRTE